MLICSLYFLFNYLRFQIRNIQWKLFVKELHFMILINYVLILSRLDLLKIVE